MNNNLNFWQDTAAKLDQRLHEKTQRDLSGDEPRTLAEFTSAAQGHLHGVGKPFIPCSAVLTYQGYTGKTDETALDVGVALRVFQHSVLLHDDLAYGGGTTRRLPGVQSFHNRFAIECGERFGWNSALFYGDALFAWAAQMLLDALRSTAHQGACMEILLQGYRELNQSRIVELVFEQTPPTFDEYKHFMDRRVAALLRTSILIGALAADAPSQDTKNLRALATYLGYAQETLDDLSHAFPPTGPSRLRDVIHAKKTLYIVYALEMTRGETARELRRILDSHKTQKTDIEKLLQIVRESGAYNRTIEQTSAYTASALQTLQSLAIQDASKEMFKEYIDNINQQLQQLKKPYP